MELAQVHAKRRQLMEHQLLARIAIQRTVDVELVHAHPASKKKSSGYPTSIVAAY